jgi:hypothetical protein
MIKGTTHNKVPQQFYRRSTQNNSQRASVREELRMIKIVDSLMPLTARAVKDTHTGIDYNFFDTTIDRKFGFYDKEEDSIKVRLKNGELINNSDYTMVMHKDRIEMFPTQRIREYTKKYPKRVHFDPNLPARRKKSGEIIFEQARITLSDLYRQQKCVPVTISIPLLRIARGEDKLRLKDTGKFQEIMQRALNRVRLLNRITKLRISKKNPLFYAKFLKKQAAQKAKKPTPKVPRVKIRANR